MKNKLWIVYIILILGALSYILFFMTIKEDKNLEESSIIEGQVYSSLESMFTMLKEENYEYTYNILINKDKYLYKGKKDKEKEKGTFTYDGNTTTYEEINDFINKDLINPTYIYNLVNNLKYREDKYDNTRVFNYVTDIDNLETEIAIYTDYTSITKINITNKKEQYSLSYKNVGFTLVDFS